MTQQMPYRMDLHIRALAAEKRLVERRLHGRFHPLAFVQR